MKKQFVRLLSLLLAVAMMVCAIPSLVAIEVGAADTITVTAEPSWDCGEINYGVFDILPGYDINMVFNKGNYTVINFSYFILSDGRIGYCIQPYKPGTTGSYTQNPGKWADFSDRRQEGIGLAFLYGAPNNGDTSNAAYFATAAVARDMACGYRNPDTSFTTNGNNGSVFTSSPFGEKLRTDYPEAYAIYNQILANIAKHGTLPSFATNSKYNIGAAQTLTLKYNKTTGLYEASATDTNGVLACFNYVSNTSGLTFTKDGNTLKVTATAEAAKNIADGVTISGRGFEFDQPEDVCTVWTAGDTTQLICVMDAATDPVPSYFKLEVEPFTGNLRFVKNTNTGAGLYGWYFDLYKDRACTVKVGTYGPTSGNGTFTATGLEPGTYYVKEVDESALYPYWDYDTTVHEVVITAGATSDVIVNNTRRD